MAESLATESSTMLNTFTESVSSTSTTVDDESSDSVEQSRPRRNERFEKLGFKPQKELFCNKFFPYADRLDDESQILLEKVKNNLGKAVAMREIGPGTMLSIRNLMTYIKLYGMKFSKEDHVKFVKLMLEMLVIPKLDSDALNRISEAIYWLLRKREWLSTDDLQIEWRPLYDLIHLVVSQQDKKGELFSGTTENTNSDERKDSPLALMLEAAKRMGYDVSSVAQLVGLGEMDAKSKDA